MITDKFLQGRHRDELTPAEVEVLENSVGGVRDVRGAP